MPYANVIIPVYNHAPKIGAVLDGCLKHFKPGEIIVVDDGSTDNSHKEAEKRGVLVYRHHVNKGKGRALLTGFEHAAQHEAKWVLTLDADGQHLPSEIPEFLKEAEKNELDLIIGKREIHPKKMPLHRIFSNSVTSKVLTKMTGVSILDSQCGYRMVRTDLLNRIEFKAVDYLLETEMIILGARLGARIGFVPISTVYSDEKSHMKNIRTIGRFIKTIWQNKKRWIANE